MEIGTRTKFRDLERENAKQQRNVINKRVPADKHDQKEMRFESASAESAFSYPVIDYFLFETRVRLKKKLWETNRSNLDS